VRLELSRKRETRGMTIAGICELVLETDDVDRLQATGRGGRDGS